MMRHLDLGLISEIDCIGINHDIVNWLQLIKYLNQYIVGRMLSNQQGYSSRYQKIKTNKLRSVSPNHYEQNVGPSPVKLAHNVYHNQIPNLSQNQKKASQGQSQSLGKVVSDLNDRVDGIQIKLINMTNIIKLLQKYTETKDMQYEKQKQNLQFRTQHGQGSWNPVLAIDAQNKINQMESVLQKAKVQMLAIEGLKLSIQRQSSKKQYSSPQPFQTLPKTINSINSPPSHYNLKLPQTVSSMSNNLNANNTNGGSNCHKQQQTKQLMEEIEDIMDRMELNLRQEMNKKIDICMQFFKSATLNLQQSIVNANTGNNAYSNIGSSRNSSPTALNAVMLQQQLHNVTLTINKVSSDCNRNKMLTQNKIQQIVNYINAIKRDCTSQRQRQRQRQKDRQKLVERRSGDKSVSRRSKTKSKKLQIEQNHSQHSSISKKSKVSQKQKVSKSKSKSKQRQRQNEKNVTDRSQDQYLSSNKIRNASQNNPNPSKSSRLEEQKRQKQLELKEALRKKKENQEKLKMRK